MLLVERSKDGGMACSQVRFNCTVKTSGVDLPQLNIELKDATGRCWHLTPTQEETAKLSTLLSFWENDTINSLASSLDQQSQEVATV